MRNLLATILAWFVGQVYVVLDGGQCVGVCGRLQGAELLRADHARAWVEGIPNPDTAATVEQIVYRRQRVECHELRDV